MVLNIFGGGAGDNSENQDDLNRRTTF